MKRYRITNDFHGTETWTTYPPAEREDIVRDIYQGRIDSHNKGYRAMRRSWKILCGYKDCLCSGSWGERGPQEPEE